MQTPSSAVTVDKTEKAGEKVVEKRRALGRGLESLLPRGPRAVPSSTAAPMETSTHSQGARTSGAPGLSEPGVSGATLSDSALSEPTLSEPTLSEPTLSQSTRKDGAAAQEDRALADDGRAEASVAPLTGSGMDLQAMAGREVEGQPVFEIAVSHIDRNPYQTRDYFDTEAMEDLARSIRAQGVIQPVVVRPGKEGRFVLVLGERRLRASKMAGKTTIPALVKRLSDQQAAEMTLIENLVRDDLMCMEQAGAFWTLSEDFNMTQEEIGKRVGVSRETVSNYLRLLNLPVQVQTYLNRGDLTFSHARELLMLKDDEQIRKLAELAVKKKMSVVQLEETRMALDFPDRDTDKKSGGARWVDPNVRAAQRNLEMILGMRVRIRDRKGKGKITIEYNSVDDYERVVGMLKGKSS